MPRFRFRPDPCGDRRRYTAYGPCPGRSLTVCRDHFDQSFRSERTLGRFPFGPAKTLGVARKYPRSSRVPRRKRRGPLRSRTRYHPARCALSGSGSSRIDQLPPRLWCGGPGPSRAVLAFVIRFAERNPRARWSDQETHREAVTVLLSVFVFAVATPFPRPFFTVAGAVGVFRFLSCLTGQRGVDEIYERLLAASRSRSLCRKMELILSFRHRGRVRKRLI